MAEHKGSTPIMEALDNQPVQTPNTSSPAPAVDVDAQNAELENVQSEEKRSPLAENVESQNTEPGNGNTQPKEQHMPPPAPVGQLQVDGHDPDSRSGQPKKPRRSSPWPCKCLIGAILRYWSDCEMKLYVAACIVQQLVRKFLQRMAATDAKVKTELYGTKPQRVKGSRKRTAARKIETMVEAVTLIDEKIPGYFSEATTRVNGMCLYGDKQELDEHHYLWKAAKIGASMYIEHQDVTIPTSKVPKQRVGYACCNISSVQSTRWSFRHPS